MIYLFIVGSLFLRIAVSFQWKENFYTSYHFKLRDNMKMLTIQNQQMKLEGFLKEQELHKLSYPNIPTILDLPKPPISHKGSLLVSFCVAFNKEQEVINLRKQLDRYVEACEMGVQVHVIISSHKSWEQYQHLFNGSAFYCLRNEANIPVVFSQVQRGGNNGELLRDHRYSFLYFKDMYDYYLVQEDDVLVTTANLLYFFTWSKKIAAYETKQSFLLPTFIDYEVLRPSYTNRESFQYLPIKLCVWTASFFLFQKTLMLRLNRPQHRSTIITNKIVNEVSKLDQWFGDENLTFVEPNVHYHSLWASRHYWSITPWSSFDHALTHHSSNKYFHIALEDVKKLNQTDHNAMIGLDEYKALVNWAFPSYAPVHKRNTLSPWNITIKLSRKYKEFVSPEDCVKLGRAATFDATYPSAFDQNRTRTSIIDISNFGKCLDMTSLPRQELERCRKGKECQPESYLTL